MLLKRILQTLVISGFAALLVYTSMPKEQDISVDPPVKEEYHLTAGVTSTLGSYLAYHSAQAEIRQKEIMLSKRGEEETEEEPFIPEPEPETEMIPQEMEIIIPDVIEIPDPIASPTWSGKVLTKRIGTVQGPSGKETYYNLPMDGVIKIMRSIGNQDEYWVRPDGVKMLGNYIMVAANLNVHPRGSLVETSLGTAIVCDTGSFAQYDPMQIDVAVTW